MNSEKTIYSQLMDFISHYEFCQCVQRYNGNYKIKASPAGTCFWAWSLPKSLSEWWWRHELDSIFFENHCEDGLAYTKLKQISWKVKPCNDPI
jgi:hypothetical protein